MSCQKLPAATVVVVVVVVMVAAAAAGAAAAAAAAAAAMVLVVVVVLLVLLMVLVLVLVLVVEVTRGAAAQGPAAAGARLAARARALALRLWEASLRCHNSLLYRYYNSRSPATDLRLFAFAYAGVMLLLAAAQHYALDDPGIARYNFGEDFPGDGAPPFARLVAVLTALTGLLGFALILALVEQVVLEGLDTNVKRGRGVVEHGHILILSWCTSQRDLEVVRKVLAQACLAFRPEGGTTVVVMSQRSKLEMESLAARDIPPSARHGTKIVFRQGSPLVPGDLALVSAHTARATLIISDQSRSAAEADAQSVRAAILVDELDDAYLYNRASGDSSFSHLHIPGGGATAAAETLASNGGAHGTSHLATLGSVVASVAASPASGNSGAGSYDGGSSRSSSGGGGGSSGSSCSGGSTGGLDTTEATLDDVGSGASQAMWRKHSNEGDRMAHELRESLMQEQREQEQEEDREQERERPEEDDGAPGVGTGARAACAWAAGLGGCGEQERHIVVEIKTANALPLVKYACSDRVSALPTGPINAQRMAQLVKRPFASMVSQQLVNFGSAMSAYAQFGDCAFRFPDGIVLGVVNRDIGGQALMAPPVEYIVQPGDSLVICRPSTVSSSDFRPLRRAPPPEQLHGAALVAAASALMGTQPRNVDRGAAADVGVVVCTNPSGACDGKGCGAGGGCRFEGGDAADVGCDVTLSDECCGPHGCTGSCKNFARRAKWSRQRATALATELQHHHKHKQQQGPQQLQQQQQQQQGQQYRHGGSMHLPLAGEGDGLFDLQDAALLVPTEYLEVDDEPEDVLVAGWGAENVMENLLRELDSGFSALPEGSSVTFVNAFPAEDTLARVLNHGPVENIRDPDRDDSNGLAQVDGPSVLRIDSLIMTVQLNIRKLLEDSRLPPINVICQK
ncbi:hypothetical protein MNEG_8845, partial [Monoraphidium neglectum]